MIYSSLLQRYLSEQKQAYVVVEHGLNVLEYGGEFALFDHFDESQPELLELIPELVGCEDILQEILDGTLPNFVLADLNRHSETGQTHYLTVKIIPYFEKTQSYLLIILQDTTAYTEVEQALTQQRNELSLLKQSLADTNQRLEFILQRYVPREVGDALLEKRILPELGGEVKEVTLLFADLRNYTSSSEKLTPDETIEMLHVYIDLAASAIAEAGGVIVNYMGDGIMAMFNAPNSQDNHCQLAVRAGLSMQSMAKACRAEKDFASPISLSFGVGINTGNALVGNIGAQWHYQYTAVGDVVNVASRICGYARPGEVLIGENVYERIQSVIKANALPPVKFKGKSQEITVYHVDEIKNSLHF